MGNANIDDQLKQEIEQLLKDVKFRVRYQNLKGFIDNACISELERAKKAK